MALRLPDRPEVLSVEAVSKTLDGHPVLDRVSLALGAGQTLTVLGSSGAGKSTLLRLVATPAWDCTRGPLTRIAVIGILGLVVMGAAPASTAALPWSTVSELESHVTQAFSATGCGDARPLGVFVVVEGADEYYLLVNADARWAILGPVDPEGRTVIWYGSFTSEDRIVIERSVVGTPQTNLCPLLAEMSPRASAQVGPRAPSSPGGRDRR